MDNQTAHEQQEAGSATGVILATDYNDLTVEEKTALAEHLSRPAVVPLHVLLILAKFVSVAANVVDENEDLYNALADEGLASMDTASDADREELGDDCPDEFATVSRDVFNAIAWANAVINPQGLDEVQDDDIEGDDEDD